MVSLYSNSFFKGDGMRLEIDVVVIVAKYGQHHRYAAYYDYLNVNYSLHTDK